MTAEPGLLRFDHLRVSFGETEAVRDVSFAVARGETVAVVGETGSGKSVAMLAALGLLPRGAAVSGRVWLGDQQLVGLGRRALDRLRGKALTIVFQEPQSALDPLYSVGSQVAAVLRHGLGLPRRAAWTRAVGLLDEVGIPEPERRARNHPHELSGGQRQRVAIAMAIACGPDVLIADEPTTALDATVAAKVMALLAELKARRGLSLVLVSHDLALVRRIADRVHVMERGRVVESGTTEAVTTRPAHPTTRALLAAGIAPPPEAAGGEGPPLIEARELTVAYPLRGGVLASKRTFTAVDHVSLHVGAGETLGLIGESGSGKSTLGRALLRLQPARGSVNYAGRDLFALSPAALRPLRRELQVVFQDPFSSLSPRLGVAAIVGEGLSIHEPDLPAAERAARVARALDEVGLSAAFAHRLPAELSGGQRQRVAIARAMVLQPRFVVLDEPTSALDRSVQADVLRLLRRLQEARGLGYLFITHDLAAVRALAHRVAVMRDGRIVEQGRASAMLDSPREAYTRELVASAALAPGAAKG